MLQFNAFFTLLLLATPVLSYSNVKMVCMVNKIRAEHGLRPMGTDLLLVNAAQIHSDDRASSGLTGSIGSDGSDQGDRLNRVGYPWTTVTENTAFDFVDEVAVLNEWMDKVESRSTILGKGEVMGSAVAYDKFGIPHYTQLIVTNGGKRPIRVPSCERYFPTKKNPAKGKKSS